jgi:hypothetical protein
VNWEKRIVRNATEEADFSDAPIEWHILRVVWKAHPEAADPAKIKEGYPGVYAKINRQVRTSKANKKLKLVGIRILNRQLIKLSETSY